MKEIVTAVFYDIENLGCCDRWYEANGWNFTTLLKEIGSERPLGQVRIQRAYLDVAKPGQEKVKSDLARMGCENVDILSKGIGPLKNAADIQLCIDAVEVLLTKDFITQFVIVSGDGDFFPLARKLRSYGKTVIGAAVDGRVNPAFKGLCDGFVVISTPRTPVVPANKAKGAEHGLSAVKDPIVRRMAKVIVPVATEGRKAVLAKAREVLTWLGSDSQCQKYVQAGTLSVDVLHEAMKYAIPVLAYDRTSTEFVDFWNGATNGSPVKLKGGFVVLRDVPTPTVQATTHIGGRSVDQPVLAEAPAAIPCIPKRDALLETLEPLRAGLQSHLAQYPDCLSVDLMVAGRRALSFLAADPACQAQLASEVGVPVRLVSRALHDANPTSTLKGTGAATWAELLASLIGETPLLIDAPAANRPKAIRWQPHAVRGASGLESLEANVPQSIEPNGPKPDNFLGNLRRMLGVRE